MSPEKQKLFDAVCAAAIYHYVDISQKAVKERKFLFKEGIIENVNEHYLNLSSIEVMGMGNNLYDLYESMVIQYVKENLPSFKLFADKYGAYYLSNKEGKEYYCGDDCGRIMIFANFEALEDYTSEVLEKE